MRHVRLTGPQEAALEQLEDGLDQDGPLDRAWRMRGPRLSFPPEWADRLFSELTDASNSEDAQAEHLRARGALECARHAARASRALGNIASKVLKES